MFARRDYGEGLRGYLADNSDVTRLVDLSELQVFEGATNYTCIITISNNGWESDGFQVYTPTTDSQTGLETQGMDRYQLSNSELDSGPWGIVPPGVATLMDSTPDNFQRLGEVCSSISEGVHTGCNEAFFVTGDEINEGDLEEELVKPLLKGKDIKRYSEPKTDLYCIYPYDETGKVYSEDELRSKYPNTWRHLETHREKLESRTYLVNSGKNWYEIWCERHPSIYQNPKILTPDIAEHNQFTLDHGEEHYYFNCPVERKTAAGWGQ